MVNVWINVVSFVGFFWGFFSQILFFDGVDSQMMSLFSDLKICGNDGTDLMAMTDYTFEHQIDI